MASQDQDSLPSKLFKFSPETPKQRLIWEALFLMPIIIAVGLFGRLAAMHVVFTLVLTIVFGVNLALRFIFVNEKGDWLFYLFGVLAGGGNDLMSMLNGVYSYTSIPLIPLLSGLLPLWMILFWGQVFLLFRKVFHVEWFQGEPFQKDGIKIFRGWVDIKLIVDIAILICLRIIIYLTYMYYFWIPALFYTIFIAVRLIIFRPKKNELLIMLILPYAFIFEGLMVTFGLYVYIYPVFLGLPLWLMLWWIFLVPLLFKAIFDRFEYFF